MSCERRIQLLPPLLANQIAAGEVVERPASVVKELVENSLDAECRTLSVELEGGGTRLIRVRDDGVGIHPDDMALALQIHATSKLSSIDELFAIQSLGFRGEALASIAAVARVELMSRRLEAEMGLKVDNLKGSVVKPVMLPLGTEVVVRELFYNTPARKRFLRSERTELLQCEDTLRRLALSHPRVNMSLIHQGKLLWALKAVEEDNLLPRLEQLIGRPFLQQSLQICYRVGRMVLDGWVAEGGQQSGASYHYLFLNGRTIRDRVMTHAIRQAFLLAGVEGATPSYVLRLELPVSEVDINVHPTKAEVRFQQSRMVHDFIAAALRSALQQGREAIPPSNRPLTRSFEKSAAVDVASTTVAVNEASPPLFSPPLIPRTAADSLKLMVVQQRFVVVRWQSAEYLLDTLSLRLAQSALASMWQPQLQHFPPRFQLQRALAQETLQRLVPLGFELQQQGSLCLCRQRPALLALCEWQSWVGQALSGGEIDVTTWQQALLQLPLRSEALESNPALLLQLGGFSDWAPLLHRFGVPLQSQLLTAVLDGGR
ncbi:DNA mismatch repair endonuclease MutL [Ectothiorhodospiraceae bacterium BW-2]|nr:DNA mismatch repair endonuclease MutL [Ectothiorhodospiraceae bacterium BW-2]